MPRSSKRSRTVGPPDSSPRSVRNRKPGRTGRYGRSRFSIPTTWKPVLAVAAAIALIVIFLAAVRGGLNSQSGTDLSPAQAMEQISNGAVVLDVRTYEEFIGGHIENSLWIPLAELSARWNTLPRDRPIILVCRSGVLSDQARDMLEGAGVENAVSLSGGLQAWVAAGFPTVAGEP
ncbi:MAG: rhodanese-like domain-containing protein [Anaerolineales bacterium]|nr:rhodanese-like domain-containing protein [Anaerolineales bacterium]